MTRAFDVPLRLGTHGIVLVCNKKKTVIKRRTDLID